MNFPKAQALVAYHAEPPGIEWDEMIDAHIHTLHAVIVDNPRGFIAARIVSSGWDDARLLDPRQTDIEGDTIHVYVAAGDLSALLDLMTPSLRQRIRWFTFQRRGYRVHRVPAARFLRACAP